MFYIYLFILFVQKLLPKKVRRDSALKPLDSYVPHSTHSWSSYALRAVFLTIKNADRLLNKHWNKFHLEIFFSKSCFFIRVLFELFHKIFNFKKKIPVGSACCLHFSFVTLFRKKKFALNFLTERNASKFAMFPLSGVITAWSHKLSTLGWDNYQIQHPTWPSASCWNFCEGKKLVNSKM